MYVQTIGGGLKRVEIIGESLIGRLCQIRLSPLSIAFHFRELLTGSYNNFFRIFDRESQRDATLEATRENMKLRQVLKPKKVCTSSGKRKKDEITVESLDFNKKILHTAWHPTDSIIAIAATNNLYLFQGKE